jgi:hypothetical protein
MWLIVPSLAEGRILAISLFTRDTALAAPTQAPTIEELRQAPAVKQALEQAWTDSLPGDPERRHEEGGWIYINLMTGELTALRAATGLRAELEIGDLPLLLDSVIVATFHTHPNPTSEGWNPGPSDVDEEVLQRLGVPGLIRADNGVYVAGPESRRGGLAGGPGFPL